MQQLICASIIRIIKNANVPTSHSLILTRAVKNYTKHWRDLVISIEKTRDSTSDYCQHLGGQSSHQRRWAVYIGSLHKHLLIMYRTVNNLETKC